MKISVIIPVYNGEKTIKNCIKSVLNQTMTDIEVIVVNDGSTDGTLEILRGFDDERLRVITQENAGQGEARNTGMEAASGEYIGFVDADDTIEPQMYEKMYEKAAEHDAEIVQCNINVVDLKGKKSTMVNMSERFVEITDNARYMAEYMADYRHSNEVWNKIFKRSFLEENSLKMPDTRKYFSEDILFNMNVIQNLRRIYFTNKAYYNYYEYETSHMHKGASRRLAQMMVLFDEFLAQADGEMYNSASFLAARVTIYNTVRCPKEEWTEEITDGLKKYARDALKVKMHFRTRLMITATAYAPIGLSMAIAKYFY